MRSDIKFGKQLKLCRETLYPDKTQEEVARDLGIGRDHLIKVEGDKAQPSYDLLSKMVDYYQTTFDFILGNTRALKREYVNQLSVMRIAETSIPSSSNRVGTLIEVVQRLPVEKQQAIIDIARIIDRI